MKDEPEVSGSASFDFTGDGEALLQELIRSHNPTREIELIMPRSWRERLFSWPWRPWHNVTVLRGGASLKEYDAIDPSRVQVTVQTHGPVSLYTERQGKKTEDV